MEVFRVRLNCIDHYQATTTKYDPQLRNDIHLSQLSKEPKVPVIRVFGSTETGQKVCAHIHGAFPYLYIEYQGSLAPEEVGSYIYRLHLSIDHALAISYRRDVYREPPRYVARITLVKGVPFYGFHVGYSFFLKIYMFNPVVMTRLADLLQQGVIMQRQFQPYEAHLQYLLQFMTDYNLYGCSYLEAGRSRVSFRFPIPQYEDEEDSSSANLWHSQSVPHNQITEDFSLPRASHCSIEVDICLQDILNRRAVKERRLHHDFIERLQPMPADMKLVHSMAGLWKDETKRRKRRIRTLAPGSSPFPTEALVSMSANPRWSQPSGWIHEEEYREHLYQLISEENAATKGAFTFENYVERTPFEASVKTALQSVEDLYPENLIPSLGLSQGFIPEDQNPASSIDVDEQGIIGASRGLKDDDLFPDDSEEELLRELVAAEHKAEVNGSTDEPIPESAAKGSVRDVTQSEGTLDDLKSRSGLRSLPRGVCVSGMRTGVIPHLPISDKLMEAAREEGLVSRIPRNKRQVEEVSHSAAKRPRSPLREAQPAKRRKVVEIRTPSQDAKARGSQLREPVRPDVRINEVEHREPILTRPATTSDVGDSTTGAANHKLNFTVVKDPNEPSTKLRLSQPSNSQRSEDEIEKKVSFEDLPSISDRDSSTKDDFDALLSRSWTSTNSMAKSPLFSSPSTLTADKRSTWWMIGAVPPSVDEVSATMQDNDLPDALYQDAFYSHEKDVPSRIREYAGRGFRLESNTLPFLPDFDATGRSAATYGLKDEISTDRSRLEAQYEQRRRECTLRSWQIAEPAPTVQEVEEWYSEKQKKAEARKTLSSPSAAPPATQAIKPWLSQIEGATPKNKYGFKYSQKMKTTSVEHEAQYMSTMSLEVHVNTRGKLVPNPEEDELQCIFWCTKSDENFNNSQAGKGVMAGIIVLSEDGSMSRRIRSQTSVEVVEESTELDVMVRMVEIVRTYDPDILTGYEVHGSSWGYLIERARLKYDYNLCDEFSRMKTQSHGRFGKESDRWGFNTTSTIRVTGRHMINIWRAMRGELNLLQYTMENVVWHLLHRRIPHYSWSTLTDWFRNGRHRDLTKVLRYYLTRTRLDIEILEENELIPRTSEQARLLGVDFFSVFSRGSQFKVESIMFRVAKPENFLLVSPSRKQVGGQNALECLPLVMEPQSAFYNSPLLVLDFQSLYPSVMIAYNLCYSTFLGRIVNWRGTNKMGFTDYKRRQGLLRLLQHYINITPNGMMYTKAEIRKSLLAKMLTEILETRVMVKSGMKQDKDDKTLQQLLNNRQLALKLLANVTYGYTSASFSGRMPCSEIADSIVQTARETLERAIAYIHSVERWNAEVVYGDTDSLFIYLKGRTKDQAFDIGNEIAKAVTDINPRPVKLKFEKVYQPCMLLAKKRYVGYKYESKDQVKPEFDAKGIETVRRDGTPAEQMIEEKALKILFETADLSQVKTYFQRQCDKIMRGRVSIQDFCFAREVKLGTYSDKGPPPAGALISTRRMLEDARAEPQYGERVPYVVITGAPGARLIDRCVAPEDLLASPHCQLDAEYYISKNLIPPLERIFNLVGANVRQWYDEMPKVQRIRRVEAPLAAGGGAGGTLGGLFGTGRAAAKTKKITLESYLRSASCAVCSAKIKATKNTNNAFAKGRNSNRGSVTDGDVQLCSRCRHNAPASLATLQTRLAAEERRFAEVQQVCRSCASLAPLDDVSCDSKDCPVFYTRVKQAGQVRTERTIVEPLVRWLARDELEW